MSNGGRPRVLDDQKRRALCTLISAGCGFPEAARYVGCSVKTIRRELANNDEFKQKLRSAEIGAQLEALSAMRKAAATHWRAAAWMLERTNPRRFRRSTLKQFPTDDMYALIGEVIESAADFIEDDAIRHRVCRRLLAAAHVSARALGVEDPNHCDAKAFVSAASGDQSLDEFLEEIERNHRRDVRTVSQYGQNPASPEHPAA